MVAVIVGEDDVRHGREIEAELLRVAKHGLGTGTRIDQEAATVDFEEGREPPLADAVLGVAREHGGEDGDPDRAGERWMTGRWRSGRRDRREKKETEGNREGPSHALISLQGPLIVRARTGPRQSPGSLEHHDPPYGRHPVSVHQEEHVGAGWGDRPARGERNREPPGRL